ncbi:MMPL family transporter [Pseudoclavibacter terrae]|uniref:MMPL family transporter n=1 Tax=Pseudoclavibacter terrae TaxID=1530195 RepID=A0A7J5AXB8_9MICO|nr:MMPL family transporter [Pseudoclavibacter terrae]KAB1636082.1 MMPL family transporter [Pseudoclavibacter terrae]
MALLLARLGRFSARRRAWVVSAWAVLLVLVAAIALGGMKFSDGSFDVPGTDSARAMEVLDQEFPSDEAATRALELVVQDPNAPLTDSHGVQMLQEAVVDLQSIPGVTAVANPLDPQFPAISADGSTARINVTIAVETDASDEELHSAVASVGERLEAEGLVAEIGGSLEDGAPEIFGPTEIVGAALAFLVLLLTFGSLVAAGANMLGALVGVGVGILGVLAFSALAPIGSVTPILAVMLGLAVGIDYCLFILSRFRSELRDGRNVEDAISRSVGTAGSSVVFAGATVIIALVGLTVVGIPFLGEMGLAAAFAVFVAVLMSLTMLPALMSWMGRRALARGDRYPVRKASSGAPVRAGFLVSWGDWVIRRPLVAGGTAVLALAVMALPVLDMQTTLNNPGGEDPASSQRAAYELVAQEFGAGAQDPLVVLVQGDGVQNHVGEVVSRISDLNNVSVAVPAGLSSNGNVALVSVIAESGPLDESTKQLVRDLRDVHMDGIELAVTGGTAIGLDSDDQLQQALVTYIVIIVGLSLLLLIVLFRSVLVPLLATLGFLLSLGAGLGATTAIFQWGWLDALVQAPQGNPLISLLPLVVTGILFGLAMDYQVFLVSRMHEAHVRGASPRDAIREGFKRSAVVVVAAAAIMAAVFGGFALSPSSLVGSIALALTVGVIADAFIVRMVIVPAALSLLGRSAWWMPAWLDRALPDLDVEGRQLDDGKVPTTPPTLPTPTHIG